nr:MAG TPA: hypothetical protein [Caudoviricetes sp.]
MFWRAPEDSSRTPQILHLAKEPRSETSALSLSV